MQDIEYENYHLRSAPLLYEVIEEGPGNGTRVYFGNEKYNKKLSGR